jgi:hypothetical protein
VHAERPEIVSLALALGHETAVTESGRSFPEIEFLDRGPENGIGVGLPSEPRGNFDDQRHRREHRHGSRSKDQRCIEIQQAENDAAQKPRVVDNRVEEYVDTSGEDALRVTVVLDEDVEVEKLKAEDITAMTREIRARVRDQGFELWPYIQFVKQSELDADGEE